MSMSDLKGKLEGTEFEILDLGDFDWELIGWNKNNEEDMNLDLTEKQMKILEEKLGLKILRHSSGEMFFTAFQKTR
jgi:hypothetical protein